MGAALPHTTRHTTSDDQLNLDLERCKRILERQFEDRRNIEQIAQITSDFMQKCFSDINSNLPQLLKYSLLSDYMLKVSLEEKEEGNKWSENWFAGFQQLTQPEHLATVPRLADNFLSPGHVFVTMEEAATEFGAETLTVTGEDVPNFLEHHQSMLRFLLLMFTVISNLPDSWSQKVFTDNAAERRKNLSMQVGSVAWNIETAVDGKLVGHRAAFMGPESKSAAIKYLTANGRERGDVINTKPKQRQSPWDNVNVLRATRLSNPLDTIELIDVPQTEEENTLAQIALNTSSTLVLCTGKIEQLQEELKLGAFQFVPDMVRTLNCSIPIICLVTEMVDVQEFMIENRAYRRLLQQWFPNNEITVLYGNFPHIQDIEDRDAVTVKLMEALLSHPSLETNPFKVFGSVRKHLELFTQRLSDVVKSSYSTYFQLFDEDLKKLQGNEEVENVMALEKPLRKKFKATRKNSIAFDLSLIHVKQVPVSSWHIGAGDAERDVAYTHEALRNDLRMVVRKWAATMSKNVHKGTIFDTIYRRDLFERLLEWNSESKLETTLLQCIAHLQQVSLGRLTAETSSKSYLTLCRPLGTLVSEEGFCWMVIGCSMIESDEFINGVPYEDGPSGTGFRNWRSEQFSGLHVPYEEWVEKVSETITRDGMNKSLLNQMDKAAWKYVDIMKKSKLLNRLNKPLEQLVQQSFIMLHRLLVHYDYKEKDGRLQFTGLVNELKEKTKVNNNKDFATLATCAADKIPAKTILEDCLRSHKALLKLHTTAKDSTLSQDLEEMKDICKALDSEFNREGKSIVFVVQLSSQPNVPNPIVGEAASLISEFNLKQVVGDEKESSVLTQEVLRAACAGGAHVVVWFRRDDSFSADPDESHGETAMLTQLNRNPYIVALHIIMGTEITKENIEPINLKMWKEYAPDLDIHFVDKEQSREDLRMCMSHLERDAKSGQEKAGEKRRKMEENFFRLHKRFQSKCREIITARQNIMNLDPNSMQKCFETTGIFHESVVKRLTDPLMKNFTIDSKWSLPETHCLAAFFEKTHATDVNESEARAFILQVLVAQTIAKAQQVAREVFDQTIAQAMVQLAEMSLWNVEDLMDNIHTIVNSQAEQDENCEEVLMYGFVVRKTFMDMYVGVVLSIAMPLLRAIVLPTIMTNRGGISDENYRKAVNKAKQELSSEVVARLARAARPATSCF